MALERIQARFAAHFAARVNGGHKGKPSKYGPITKTLGVQGGFKGLAKAMKISTAMFFSFIALLQEGGAVEDGKMVKLSANSIGQWKSQHKEGKLSLVEVPEEYLQKMYSIIQKAENPARVLCHKDATEEQVTEATSELSTLSTELASLLNQ